MIAPNPKYRPSADFERSGWSLQELPDQSAPSSSKQRARRAAVDLLFGNRTGSSRTRRPVSPWAVITVWLLTVWMLVAVAVHFSWMLHSLGKGS